MKKNKDITHVYYVILLIAAYFMFCFVATMTCRGYFYSQQKTKLTEEAEQIAGVLSADILDNGQIDIAGFRTDIENLNKYTKISYIITGPNLRIYKFLPNSEKSAEFLSGVNVNELINGKVGEYKGTLGVSTSPNYFIAYPLIKNDVTIFIFVYTPIVSIQLSIFYASLLVSMVLFMAFLIGYYLITVSMEKSQKPIRAMNEVAKALTEGDYSRRVEIIQGNREVAQLCQNFNIMAESLSKQDDFKNAYISNISHDIRSPLTTIKGFVEAIMDGTVPKEKVNHYLEVVYNEADRLNKLGSSLLELSKMDLNKKELKRESFDIVEFMRDCVDSVEDKCRQKNITIETDFSDENIYINADVEKMQRICYNLVDNAIKYTNNNGKIKVCVYTTDYKKAVISVEDNGIGISEEDQKHIFERLYKVDKSRGADKTSVGLGLAIVKEMIEAHGETISVISQKGKGSRFVFEMPLDTY
ncbi:MAG: HAMP domain-containing histidine kinase [Firmicutes bacterium]|nr:HAMP domain-containing histidine kinase [Bacillota bacterium]